MLLIPRALHGWLLGSLLLILSGGLAAAEPLPRATRPEEVGLSSARLERLTRVTQAHVESGRLPGAVLLLARYGKIAYLHSFGYRDRSHEAPMMTDAIFRIYSMTKPITSVALMMLYEEGKLQLYDPVSRYLPEFAGLRVGVEKTDPTTGQTTLETVETPTEMTIQDLLRHTSGLTNPWSGKSPVQTLYREAGIGSRQDTNAQLVSKLSKLPLLYPPGTRWEYGISTDVLGRLIEVLSGQSLGSFFEERILRPLGMQDTGFAVPAAKLGRLAQPWARPHGPPMTPRFDAGEVPAAQAGGKGLVSTAGDYYRFAQMLLGGGECQGVRLLGRKTVEYMTADHLGAIPYEMPRAVGLSFGLGFEVRRTLGQAVSPGSVGEYGWSGVAGTHFWVDPQEQLVAIYMVQANEQDRRALRDQFKVLVLQSLTDEPGRAPGAGRNVVAGSSGAMQ
ncbi:MAG: serine hydrolase domain-containing protein [Candidatus Tectimicrobiota bacterium]